MLLRLANTAEGAPGGELCFFRRETAPAQIVFEQSPTLIREYERLDEIKRHVPTHDDISDAFQGKASDAWYWYHGKWIGVGHWH
jgi:hypothetical protein